MTDRRRKNLRRRGEEKKEKVQKRRQLTTATTSATWKNIYLWFNVMPWGMNSFEWEMVCNVWAVPSAQCPLTIQNMLTVQRRRRSTVRIRDEIKSIGVVLELYRQLGRASSGCVECANVRCSQDCGTVRTHSHNITIVSQSVHSSDSFQYVTQHENQFVFSLTNTHIRTGSFCMQKRLFNATHREKSRKRERHGIGNGNGRRGIEWRRRNKERRKELRIKRKQTNKMRMKWIRVAEEINERKKRNEENGNEFVGEAFTLYRYIFMRLRFVFVP